MMLRACFGSSMAMVVPKEVRPQRLSEGGLCVLFDAVRNRFGIQCASHIRDPQGLTRRRVLAATESEQYRSVVLEIPVEVCD
jgi:hypothetical protein